MVRKFCIIDIKSKVPIELVPVPVRYFFVSLNKKLFIALYKVC